MCIRDRGKCLETYLNQLLRAGVTLLCDVRRNPLSRKYGFSKSTLSHACAVSYTHLRAHETVLDLVCRLLLEKKKTKDKKKKKKNITITNTSDNA